jgi:MFS superfamily sulfate permease-like transporter
MHIAHTPTAALALCVMVLLWSLSRSEKWRNNWVTQRLSDLLLVLVVGLVVWYFAQR